MLNMFFFCRSGKILLDDLLAHPCFNSADNFLFNTSHMFSVTNYISLSICHDSYVALFLCRANEVIEMYNQSLISSRLLRIKKKVAKRLRGLC